ncbi:XRE family transcriptional regulator [Brevibacterium permense]|nr:XRE family transcriptional regulator [Brevibacterium permense]
MTISEMDSQMTTHDTPATDAAMEVKLWTVRKRVTQKRLSGLLGLPQSSVSARLNGKKPFSIDELYKIAGLMELSLGELLGERLVNEKNPQPVELAGGSATLVAGEGFEPSTSGL